MNKEIISNSFTININKKEIAPTEKEIISNSFTVNINKKEIVSSDIFESINLLTNSNIKANTFTRIALQFKTRSDINNIKINPVIEGNNIEIKNVQWEKGKILTDYRPSITEITQKNSELEIGLDNISGSVSKIENDYITESEMNLNTKNIELKFSQSGGYNLLYNGDFKRELNNWTITTGTTYSFPAGTLSSPDGYGIKIEGNKNDSIYFIQAITDPKVLANKDFVLSAYNYISGSGTDAANVKYTMSARIKYKDDTTDYFAALNTTAPEYDKWKRLSVTFSRDTTKEAFEIAFVAAIIGTDRSEYFSQVMLQPGNSLTGWTPNPNEVFDGITVIDKDGIKVRNTVSETRTSIDAESFRVENLNGGTVAEFSENSTIPSIEGGFIRANSIHAANVASKNFERNSEAYVWYVNSETGDDKNSGEDPAAPLRTLQKAIDNLPDILTRSQDIFVYGSHTDMELRTLEGHGILTIKFMDNAVMNGRLYAEGVHNRMRITANTIGKPVIKGGISLIGCNNVDIYGVNVRGLNKGDSTCSIIVANCAYVALNTIDIGGISSRIEHGVKVNGSTIWTHNLTGSNILNVISQYAFSFAMIAKTGVIKVPDYTGSYHYAADGGGRYQNLSGATLQKTPSNGWDPEYTPTKKTRTWDFNKIWSDETYHGWSNRNELIQGYASAYDTGRWTGFLQMTDNMSAIKSAIAGGTNLSGRLYVQRRSSSGASTGTVCGYASDGTALPTYNVYQGYGVWIPLSSSIIEKIKSGSITYFYFKNDSNNINTYMKFETLGKIEITYTN